MIAVTTFNAVIAAGIATVGFVGLALSWPPRKQPAKDTMPTEPPGELTPEERLAARNERIVELVERGAERNAQIADLKRRNSELEKRLEQALELEPKLAGARVRIAVLEDGLRRITRLDKTEYAYQVGDTVIRAALDRDGNRTAPGQRFKTPREVARELLNKPPALTDEVRITLVAELENAAAAIRKLGKVAEQIRAAGTGARY